MPTRISASKAISSNSVLRRTGCLMMFFGIFSLVGAAGLAFLVVLPTLRILQARDWVQTPCEIVSSRLETHQGSGRKNSGPTYSIAVEYRYEIDGVSYTGERHSFMGGSSSSKSWREKWVSEHRAGTRSFCFVNPRNPGESVIDRGWSTDMLFGLIPLVFLVVGVGGMLWAWRRGSGLVSPAIRHSNLGFIPEYPQNNGEPVLLKPATTAGMQLVAVLAFAAIWNSAVGVLVYQVVDDFRNGHGSWGLLLFSIPFVLIGLVALAMIPYQFLAMFNPRMNLTVGSPAVELGQPLDLSWDLVGDTSRVEKLTVELEGREEATYRRGTRTVTDSQVFYRRVLFESEDPQQLVSNLVSTTIPLDCMHSFESSNNKIIWSVRVRAPVRARPDIKQEFRIVVLPLSVRAAADRPALEMPA